MKLVAYYKFENYFAYISVMITPCFSKLLHKVAIHKLIISLSRLLEGLPYDGNEQLHRDLSHYDRVGEEEDFGGHFRTTPHWLFYKILNLISFLLLFWK